MINDHRYSVNNLPIVVLTVFVIVLYYSSAQLGLMLAFQETNASPVWPPSGIALVAVLLLGKRVLYGVFIGAFLANLNTFINGGDISIFNSIFFSVFIGVGNTLEALAGLALLQKITGKSEFPFDLKGILQFILVTMIMCLVSSVIGTSVLFFAGIATIDLILNIWFTWWLGDAVGILTVVPFLMCWAIFSSQQNIAKRWPELILIVLLTSLTAGCVFGDWFLPEFISSLPYLVVPLMFWSAFRFGLLGGANSIILVSSIAVIGTVNGHGGFAIESTHTSLLLLQTFIFIIASTTLLLAAAIEDIKRSDAVLKRLNSDLVNHQFKLESSNNELEAFCYSISHDLRAPLRRIDGFSQALKDDLGDKIDIESKDHLNRVRAAAQHMKELIDDLLNLSRLSQIELKRKHTDLSDIANTILLELKQTDSDRDVVVKCDQPLYAYVDPTLIRIALENLIGNAWKYSSENDETYIEIGKVVENGIPHFYIKDNGIGFDMEHSNKLFGVFQRLHDNSNFEGTGIGLAIVARIIKRHGGKVWGVGTVGKGAEFKFTVTESP